MKDGSILAAAVAADNVVTNLHFLLIVLLPGVAWMANRYPTHHMDMASQVPSERAESVHQIENLDIAGMLAALALAFILAALGKMLAGLAGMPQFAILVTTALTLFIATLLPGVVARLSGYTESGNALMFIFLASIGATAVVRASTRPKPTVVERSRERVSM